jgi:hypothetical protein
MSERLDNFRGKRHTFTQKERCEGGSNRGDLKIFRSQINAIKKGKYKNKLKHCDSCSIPLCSYFEKGKSCSLFNTKFVKLVMFKKNLSTIEEFDDYIFGFLQRGTLAQEVGSYESLSAFAHEMLEFREFKNESLK